MAVPACCINKASGTGPPRHDETGPLALWRHSYPSPPAETIRVNLRSSAHPGPAVNPSPSPGRPARPPSGLRRAAGVRPAAGCPMTRLAFSATFRDGDLFAPGNPVESPGEMGLRLEGANRFHAASRPRRRAFSLRRRVLGRRGSGHGAGRSIRSTDAAATPSSVAPGRSARRAHRRPGRPGGAAQQRSWALHPREKPSTEVASSGIPSGPVSTRHSQ